MFGPFRALDRILRGEATRLPDLMKNDLQVPIFSLSITIIILAGFYGDCMGTSAVIAHWDTRTLSVGYEQALASMFKVPLLFILTLIVTFPSLYVFNALVGSRLGIMSLLRLLIATMAVMISVLASFGPIAIFFALSTTSHPFMVLLNTAIFTVAGVLGLAFLLRTLQRLTVAMSMREKEAMRKVEPLAVSDTTVVDGAPSHIAPLLSSHSSQASGPAAPAPSAPLRPGALERLNGDFSNPQVTQIFRIWVIVFALVGAQMAWILRPFIGQVDQPFQLFCPRESNFFAYVLQAILELCGVKNP